MSFLHETKRLILVLFFLQQNIRWINNSPLSFQNYFNTYFGRQKVDTFFCSFPSPSSSTKQLCEKLVGIKQKSLTRLYPLTNTQETCHMLLMTNLAETEWVNIFCQDTLLAKFVCFAEPQTNLPIKRSVKNSLRGKGCLPKHFLVELKCHFFEWFYKITPLISKVPFLKFKFIQKFKFLLNAIGPELPPTLQGFDTHNNCTFRLGHLKMLNRI